MSQHDTPRTFSDEQAQAMYAALSDVIKFHGLMRQSTEGANQKLITRAAIAFNQAIRRAKVTLAPIDSAAALPDSTQAGETNLANGYSFKTKAAAKDYLDSLNGGAS